MLARIVLQAARFLEATRIAFKGMFLQVVQTFSKRQLDLLRVKKKCKLFFLLRQKGGLPQ
jgi:hypothetical protein